MNVLNNTIDFPTIVGKSFTNIRYPTDLSILNKVWEKTEAIIDALHRPDLKPHGL